MQRKIKNINDLRNSLLDDYEKLRSGEISVKEAKEASNKAGKIMQGTRLELEYAISGGKNFKIPFLEVDYSKTENNQ